MDTTSWILLGLVAAGILGQLCLPLLGRYNARKAEREMARKRALMLEQAAADQEQRMGGTDGR
jgi:hypothetical protein